MIPASDYMLLLLVVLNVMLCCAQTLTSSGVYKRIYTDGPRGTCEITSSDRNTAEKAPVGCVHGWIKNGTLDSKKLSSPNKRRCKFYKKTAFALCYDGPAGELGLGATCTRTAISYYISPACSGMWLNWEECDKTCGSGVRARVKIVKFHNDSYQLMTELRPCNTQPCPTWTPWKPARVANNSTTGCDVKSCTREWRRQCIHNFTAVKPTLCAEESESINFDVSEYQNNSTYQIRPCFMSECNNSTHAPSVAITAYSVSISDYKSPQTTASETPEVASMSNDRSLHPTKPETAEVAFACNVGSDNMLLGVGVGFAVASCIFAMGCFVLHRRQFLDKINSFYSESLRRGKSERRDCRSGSILTAVSGTFGRSVHMQPEPTILSPVVVPPLRIEEGVSLVNGEAIYCTVANQSGDNIAPTINRTALPSDQPTDLIVDPLYSHIPVYISPATLNDAEHENLGTENDTVGAYSSSEFSSSGESSIERKSSHGDYCAEMAGNVFTPTVVNMEVKKEEGCKSFDSDEGRDVVNTLRKPSRKLKITRCVDENDANEVFFSEDELLKEEYENERKSAFSARYAKLLAKKSKLTQGHKSHSIKGNKHAEFKWMDGGRPRSSTQSECSIHSMGSKSTRQESTRSRESFRGHQKLSYRNSSGTSSVASFNMDATTSGYNSALGESPEEDHSSWNKRSSLDRRRLSHSSDPSGWWRMRNLKNECCRNGQINNDQMVKTEIDPRLTNSLYNPKTSRLAGFGKQHSVAKRPNSGTWHPMQISHTHSLPLKARHGCHISRIVETEDIYSSPIDAKVVKDPIYAKYNIPFDALPRSTSDTIL